MRVHDAAMVRTSRPIGPRSRPIAVPQLLDSVYSIALVVTLWATAVGLGASHNVRDFRLVLGRGALFVRLTVLDVLIVPVLVLALVRLTSMPDPYAFGVLLVGTASAGALGLKTSHLARGDLPLAIALVFGLEIANIFVMPIWASLLMPGAIVVPLAEIWLALILGILLPLGLGLAAHVRAPGRAVSFSHTAMQLSTMSLAVLIGTILVRDGSSVIDALGSGVPAVAVAATLAVLALGWLFGGPDGASRRTAALVSSARANTVALAVATTMFGASNGASSAIVVFGLISTVISSGAAVLLGRRERAMTYDPRPHAIEAR